MYEEAELCYVTGADMLGDIILVGGVSKISWWNVVWQRLLTVNFASPPYSHAALLVGEHTTVHAQTDPGHVELTLIHELLIPGKRWSVWRHQRVADLLQQNENVSQKYRWRAELYAGEKYNYRLFTKNADHSFCSELVGKVYAEFGFPFVTRPHLLLPLSIHREVCRGGFWKEVTDEYRERVAVDAMYDRLYNMADPCTMNVAYSALQAAKRDCKVSAYLSEAIEGKKRHHHWKIEQQAAGLEAWTLSGEISPKTSPSHKENSDFERFYLTFYSLLMFDLVDTDFVDTYPTLELPGWLGPDP